MLLSSFFARSMAFTHTPKVQLPFALFSETFLTIRQNSLYVTVCIIARPSYRGYFIHSLSTLHYCNAPSLATRLTKEIIFRLYRFSFHKPIKSRLVRDAYICPSNSRTALQNLRVTLWNSGYGMSVYLVVAKFKVFNSLQFKKLCFFDRYDTR